MHILKLGFSTLICDLVFGIVRNYTKLSYLVHNFIVELILWEYSSIQVTLHRICVYVDTFVLEDFGG